jgi:predicted secreted protein
VSNDTNYQINREHPNNLDRPNILNSLKWLEKPIIGLGEGGYEFFGKLNLSIGSPNGARSSFKDITVIDPNCSLFSTPYTIDITQDGTVQLYTETDDIAIYLWPDIPETIAAIATESGNTGYYPLLMENNQYFLWGFTESPEKMTETGKKLFINTVIWTAYMYHSREVNVDDDDSSSQVTIEQRQTLVVTLESNIPIGYHWEVVEDPNSILEQVGGTMFLPSDPVDYSPGGGSAGWDIFRFKAVSSGRETLELIYRKSLETDAEPAKTFSIDVIVN